jgi:uroporphyrinogen decarboxylase
LANAETFAGVKRYEWPDPDYLDFSPILADLRGAGDVYRTCGMWVQFYHNLMDLYGMENYRVKMYTHPEVVQSATDLVDAYFIGNDFSTQRDLICGLKQFDQFI